MAIGEHVSEKLACKPLEFYVKREVYPQYACRACEQVVAPAVIDRGQADASLLAQVAIAKYVDHLPLYRQEAIYARSGITLARTTLAEWVGAVGVALQPLADRLGEQLRQQPVLHADETPVQLLDPGAGKTKRAYLFAYGSARHPGAGPAKVVFEFQPSRSGAHARAFLAGWEGSLIVGEYGGNKALWTQGVTELACWAHARRKWFDQHIASGSAIAAEALARIAVLYRIKAQAQTMTVEARHAHLQQHAVPALATLKQWLDELQSTVLGNSGTAKALASRCAAGLRWRATWRTAVTRAFKADRGENCNLPSCLLTASPAWDRGLPATARRIRQLPAPPGRTSAPRLPAKLPRAWTGRPSSGRTCTPVRSGPRAGPSRWHQRGG